MAGACYPPVTGPATMASPSSLTTVAQEASSVVGFPQTHQQCCGNHKNRGSGRRQTALGDVEKQGLFSTGAGSEESPPESEHQVFVLSNSYTLQGLDFPM